MDTMDTQHSASQEAQHREMTDTEFREKVEKIISTFYREMSYEVVLPQGIHDDVYQLFMDGIQAGLPSHDLLLAIKYVQPKELFVEPYSERVKFLRMKTGKDTPTLFETTQDAVAENLPFNIGEGFDKNAATREILASQQNQLTQGLLLRLAALAQKNLAPSAQ